MYNYNHIEGLTKLSGYKFLFQSDSVSHPSQISVNISVPEVVISIMELNTLFNLLDLFRHKTFQIYVFMSSYFI